MLDDAADVGHRWRPMDSPKAAAAHLLTVRGLPPAATEALGRLASATERARYARPDARSDTHPDARPDTHPDARAAAGPGASPTGPSMRADAALVRAALLASTSRRVRWRARLAPPSTLRWASGSLGSATADLLDRLDGLVTAVGERLRRRRAQPR